MVSPADIPNSPSYSVNVSIMPDAELRTLYKLK